jgi:hypothetical protein
MRATLEQLKAMSDGDLLKHWLLGKFPFESLPGCRACLTGHSFDYRVSCDHQDFGVAVRSEIGANHEVMNGAQLRPWLDEMYALRLFYDHLYPSGVTVEGPPNPSRAVAIALA